MSLGIILGLFLGKQIGIFSILFLAKKVMVNTRIFEDLSFRQLYGISLICGIGFTMSIFIGTIAFVGLDNFVDLVKMGVVVGSLVSGSIGYVVLYTASKETR